MVSKKSKSKKQKIQERQKQTPPQQKSRIQSLLDVQHQLHGEKREAVQLANALQLANRTLERDLRETERKLKARDKDVADMHNNHIKMRESLTIIRELHLPVEPSYDVHDDVPCAECGKRWPCPTYRKIRTPDHVVVSSLIDMVRTMERRPDADDSGDSCDLGPQDEFGEATDQANRI